MLPRRATLDVPRALAHLEVRWRALALVTLCPWRIPASVAAALVLGRGENLH
ncbi:hypothetical protein [Kineococcus sp. SYSU DK006]|uniref:hypothetical protein n=1 Tax=Kineococcus sp. SYSU DK006 TaxID=3383127 RepID=UPI003D7CCA07